MHASRLDGVVHVAKVIRTHFRITYDELALLYTIYFHRPVIFCTRSSSERDIEVVV